MKTMIFESTPQIFNLMALMQNVSPTCLLHMQKFMQNLFNGSLWALKMFDASTKVPASVLMGNMLDYGNFEECVEVHVDEEWGSFDGQHCVTQIEIPVDPHKIPLPSLVNSMPVLWSLCIPATCSSADLQHMLESIIPYNVSVKPAGCNTRHSEPLQASDWIAIFFFILVFMLTFTGTVHSLLEQDPAKQKKWLNIFSMYNNGRSLLSTKLSADSLPALHGVRFLSIAWVVIGHFYEYTSYLPHLNYLTGKKEVREWKYLLLINAPLSVDTFMLLSGLLLSYVFLKTISRVKRFSLPAFYFHRLMRIWPVLGTLTLFQATLLTKLGSGPLWKYSIVNEQSRYCKENWWTTMLFINNYVRIKEMCLAVTWFLAVDVQLYFISPILLLLLWKRPRLGIGIIIVACLVGIGVSFQQAYYYQDNPSVIQTRGLVDDRYYHTHTRFVPWLIGIMCGYLIYKINKQPTIDILPKRVVICGWILSMVLCVAVIHWIYPMQQEDYEFSALETSLYISLAHPLWTLGVSWIIFACVSGYGGFVNSFLTWKPLIPLSRLTYCIYIVHYILLCVVLGNTKTSGFLSNTDLLISVLGHLSLSVILSTFVTLLIETPFLGIEKILLRKLQPSSKNMTSELLSEDDKKHQLNIKQL